METKKIIKLSVLIILIGKLILGYMLVDQYGLKNIITIELPYILISLFIFFNIKREKLTKASLSFLILFDIFNSLLMNFLFKTTYVNHSYYFHPLLATTYLIFNYNYIKWSWLNLVINLYALTIIIYTAIVFYLNNGLSNSIFVHHIIALFFISVNNLLIRIKK